MSRQRMECRNEVLIFIEDESYDREEQYVDIAQYSDELAYVDAAIEKCLEGL